MISIQTLKKMKNEDLFADYYAETNEERKEDIKNDIFRKNLGLANSIVRKYENTGMPFDELMGIASFGLLKAFNTFDPSKGWKFATYASTCMNNEILMRIRKDNRHKGVITLEESISTDDGGNELTLLDVVVDTSTYDIEKQEQRSIIRELIRIVHEKFNAIEVAIFENFLLAEDEKLTQRELSHKLGGLSQSYISRLEKKVFKKVRKLAISKGLIEAHEFNGEGIFTLPKASKPTMENKEKATIEEAPVSTYHISELDKGAGESMENTFKVEIKGKRLIDKVEHMMNTYPGMKEAEIATHLGANKLTVRTYMHKIKTDTKMKKPKIDLQGMVDKAVKSDLEQVIRQPITTDAPKGVIENTVKHFDQSTTKPERAYVVQPPTVLKATGTIEEAIKTFEEEKKQELRKTVTPKKLELNLVDASGYSVKKLIESLLHDVTEDDLYRLNIKIERKGDNNEKSTDCGNEAGYRVVGIQ